MMTRKRAVRKDSVQFLWAYPFSISPAGLLNANLILFGAVRRERIPYVPVPAANGENLRKMFIMDILVDLPQ